MARARRVGVKKISDASKIQQIRQGLARLAARAPERPGLFTTKPTWSEEELTRFEAERGITLPSGYRLYLREIGDGGAGFARHEHFGGIRSLRDADKKELAKLKKRSTVDEPVHPVPRKPRLDGWLYLGVTSDHCEYYLVVNGARAGEVWIDGSGIEEGSLAPEEPADFLDLMLAWLVRAEASLDEEELDRRLVQAFAEGRAKAALAEMDEPARDHAMAVFFFEGPQTMARHVNAGRLEETVALAERSLELFPDHLWVWSPFTFACVNLAQKDAARAKELAAMLEPHVGTLAGWLREPPPKVLPSIPDLFANVTALYVYAKRFPDALRLLEQGRAVRPFPFHNLLNALLGDGQVERAEEVLNEAVALEGDSGGYRVQRAKILARRGDDARAIEELAALKRLGAPTFAGLRFNEDLRRLESVAAFRALFDT